MIKKIVNINAEYTAFDYDSQINNLRLTFDLKNEEIKKIIEAKIPLGIICNIEIIYENNN